MTLNNTTFEERLAARLKQMGERIPPVLTEEQKERNRICARTRYENRTDAQKEAGKKRDKERYRIKTDGQKKLDAATAKKRYENRTDAQKEDDRRRDRERYHRTHPNARQYWGVKCRH